MGINTSCLCANIIHQEEKDEAINSSTMKYGYNSSIKHKELPKSEIVLTQTTSSELKTTKICIIPIDLIHLCFKTYEILVVNDEGLFFETIAVCNYLNSSSFMIVIFQSIKGNEDLCSYYFKRRSEYVNIYQIASINCLTDNISMIKETFFLELNKMLNKNYYLIGAVCVDNFEYKFLFKQKFISNVNLEQNSHKFEYLIEVFESKNKVINKKEIDNMIQRQRGNKLICFIQYCLNESDKSAFFFFYKNHSNNMHKSSSIENQETKISEFLREQIPTERFVKNLSEQINDIDITSAFGSNDCVYITYV